MSVSTYEEAADQDRHVPRPLAASASPARSEGLTERLTAGKSKCSSLERDLPPGSHDSVTTHAPSLSSCRRTWAGRCWAGRALGGALLGGAAGGDAFSSHVVLCGGGQTASSSSYFP